MRPLDDAESRGAIGGLGGRAAVASGADTGVVDGLLHARFVRGAEVRLRGGLYLDAKLGGNFPPGSTATPVNLSSLARLSFRTVTEYVPSVGPRAGSGLGDPSVVSMAAVFWPGTFVPCRSSAVSFIPSGPASKLEAKFPSTPTGEADTCLNAHSTPDSAR